MKRLALILLLLLAAPLPAAAQGITRQAVEAFYAESDRLQVADPAGYGAFMEAHIHPGARYEMDMTTTIPTQPVQREQMTLTKADVLTNHRENMARGIVTTHSETRVTDFAPLPDGSVEVQTRSQATSRTPIHGEQGERLTAVIDVRFESTEVLAMEGGALLSLGGMAQGTGTFRTLERAQ